MNTNRAAVLSRENIIWAIYIFFAIAVFKSNNLELEDLKEHSNKNRKTFNTIRLLFFIVSIIIQIYFVLLTISYVRENKKRSNFLLLFWSIFLLTSGIFILLAEIDRQNEI